MSLPSLSKIREMKEQGLLAGEALTLLDPGYAVGRRGHVQWADTDNVQGDATNYLLFQDFFFFVLSNAHYRFKKLRVQESKETKNKKQ